jgi:hypothetical protein
MPSILPLGLVERCLPFLRPIKDWRVRDRSDKDLLRVCALVCRAWTHPCQLWLFHAILLDNRTFDRLLRSTEGALHLRLYVEELQVMLFGLETFSPARSIFIDGSLPNVKRIVHITGPNL